MADSPEQDSKTEEPSEKRRTDTLERDGGPVSKEVSSAVVLLVVSGFLSIGAPGLFSHLAHTLAVYIEDPGAWRIENGEDAVQLLYVTAATASRFAGFFIAALCISAIISSFLQNSPRILPHRIMPDFSRVSLSAGLGRLLSSQSLIELLKGLVKVTVAALAVYAAIGGPSTALLAIQSPPDAVPELIRHLCLRVVFFCAVMACIIAVLDVFLTRRNWRQGIMMSKQEVKEEMKESEGDRALKGRLRMIARARIRRRMMSNVPKSTVVITNPTHYAVALRYIRKEDAAPKVLAKGQDHIALKIREIAKYHNIPIIENKTLARTLYDATQVDQVIPPEFYKAVAEIIIYLDAKSRPPRRKTPGGTFRRPPSLR